MDGQRAAAMRSPRWPIKDRGLGKNNWTQLLNCAFPDKSGLVIPEHSLDIVDSAEISNMSRPVDPPFDLISLVRDHVYL